jgi:hypothetical protein
MRRSFCIAMTMAVVLASCAEAQAPANQFSVSPATPAEVVPLDQQASREQLAKLFEVMRLRQQFDSLVKMLPDMVAQQVRSQMQEMTARMPNAEKLTADQQAALDKLMQKYMDKARTIYPVDQMIADAITVYQRHMSRQDVESYLAFFSSPPGQHFLDAQPVIMKEYLPLAMQRAQENSRELNAEMAADLEKFVKEQAAPAK